jgi:phosphatidylinositol alpha-1,6-mannosyltransferase
LFWHLNVAKAVTLTPAPRTRKILFLHGIECWRILNALERHSLKHVDMFLSNSVFTWEQFVSFNPQFKAAPHITVPLGADVPLLSLECRTTEQAAFMISRLVRVEDYKGHRELLSAWPLVLHTLPAAQLWIAGAGDLAGDLKEQAKALGVEVSVRFLGAISDSEREDCFARSRCFAMPSRGEGFGLVYLEAMRHGRPCLVSTLDAGREVVNPPEAGLAVDPADTNALAEAFIRLLTPGSEWEAWSRQARARYESNFTAAHFQQRLLKALSL